MWAWEAEKEGLVTPYVTLKAAKASDTPEYLATERRGNNRLTLHKLKYPRARMDGKRVAYQVTWTWYEDASNVSVLGVDRTFWSLKELKETGIFKGKPIMDCFSITE